MLNLRGGYTNCDFQGFMWFKHEQYSDQWLSSLVGKTGGEREEKRTAMEKKLVKNNMKWEGLPNNKRCIGRNKRTEGRTSIPVSHLRKNSLGYPGLEKNKSFEYPEVAELLKRRDYSITLWSNSEISLSKELRFWRVTLRKRGHWNLSLEPIHFLHGRYL